MTISISSRGAERAQRFRHAVSRNEKLSGRILKRAPQELPHPTAVRTGWFRSVREQDKWTGLRRARISPERKEFHDPTTRRITRLPSRRNSLQRLFEQWQRLRGDSAIRRFSHSSVANE